MALKVEIDIAEQLLEMLARKTKAPLDFKGFGEMSEQMNNGVTQKYLYESVFRKKENAKTKAIKTINFQSGKLELLSQFLGFESYRILLEKISKKEPVLLSCMGTYYNYVRRNSETGVLFRSPVQITERDGKIWYELKGPKWNYSGEMELKNGCLFVLMRAEGGKEIHHVYKIGTREQPKVLQGIFSGVSTAFEPIGGRIVLIRSDEMFTALKNDQLDISQLKKSKELTERRLAEYFSTYEANNLMSKKTDTFGIDDLGTCK